MREVMMRVLMVKALTRALMRMGVRLLVMPIYPYFVEFLFWFISCLPSCLVPTSTTWKTSLFLHHHLAPIFSYPNTTPGARITCELLNGKNFAAWSRSVRLFLGGKGKSGWLLGTITKPNATDPKFVQWEIDNCTILGWLFNSMEPRIYHVFMYHDMVSLLWSSLTKMHAHAHNEARIFELYREIHQASQASLSLSVADYFAYLQSRWEELAQYEPLSEFTTEGGITACRLDRQHTYQFLMGLKPEFEALCTQIVNTTPMPSIFEAFAMLDGDERRHRLLQLPPPPVTESTIPDQMALAASGSHFSGGRSSSGWAPCSFCGGVTHGRDRCFKFHPELRETFKRNNEKSKASPRTAAISETSYGSPAAPTAPDLHQLQTQFQNQMKQLQLQFQTQLGSLMQQSPRPNPSPSTATLASSATVIHFQDFNAEVLRCLTIPNVNAKLLKKSQSLATVARQWNVKDQNCSPVPDPSVGYDIILMAETVYSVSALPHLYELLKKCLNRPNGVVYMAAKKHYFGGGGGSRRFLSVLEKDAYKVFDTMAFFPARVMAASLIAEVSDGSSNVPRGMETSF
ncbi:putative methyltransferase family protein [Actinidia rufa]|uniref:Putative methyltransferase family protein n=1 Tax=Actinidia rufa TaxID=165716 RepID=A0A7J0F316_9ERIC|nr:putative methyltransferase family protein [Actinidia rufa]